MTAAELSFRLGARSNYVDRHRPILLHIEIALFVVGLFFYVSGVTWPGVFQESTWGSLAYEQPAWVWGAINASSAFVVAIGLMRPVKNAMVAIGSSMQIMHMGAIASSCIFYGGDYGIGIYAVALLALHCKVLYESVKGL